MNRDFVMVSVARGAAIVGAEMAHTTMAYDLYSAHRDPLLLGALGFAQFLPMLLCALPSGEVADRRPRKQTVIACLLLLVAWSAALAVVDRTAVAITITMAMLFGSIRVFLSPSLSALTAALVPPGEAARYAAVNSMVFCVAVVTGPVVAGALLAVITSTTVMMVVIGLMVIAVVAMTMVAAPPQPSVAARTTWRDALEGLRIVRDNRLLLATLGIDFVAVFLGGVTALLPVFALDVLHLGPAALGFMRAAPGFGALVMAMVLTVRPLRQRQGVALLFGVAIFGVATIAFGVSQSFPLSLALLAVLGAADMVSVVVRGTLLQTEVRNDQRGRVNAVNQVFIGGSNELGEFESGVLARLWSPQAAVIVGGIGTLLVVAACLLGVPELRRLNDDKHKATGRPTSA